ncbi:MAG TPA: FKBP-type peptidyl-prolyl cis-trans isomerase [Vicinamibacterales bacterium]|nr:FKBP-type peptidyl-prolyl cis-trans isomerase [Vicinamibacterales bacterium]
MRTRWITAMLVGALAFGGCKLKDNSTGMPAPPDVAAPPADALKTASGLAYKVLTVGLGSIHPDPSSSVRVHYTGWTTDGKMFESTVGSEPAQFQVRGVIPGWTEMLQLMVVGEKVRVWIPAALAYGDNPGGGSPAGMLVFEMELLDIR